MITLTRRYRFCAAHRLHAASLGEEENRAIYGKCNNPHGHGHNYVVDVSVEGPVDRATGRVVDLQHLDALVRALIVSRYDHRNLNTEVPELSGKVPTTEVVTEAIEQHLAKQWPAAFPAGVPRLRRVRIWETRNNQFEAVAI
jgi:6-pyruvoyltetrahydropterin/6-carboxytetrahydropterin synthase